MIPASSRVIPTVFLLLFLTIFLPVRTIAADMPPAADVFSGSILETMNAAGYTYVHLDAAGGPVWVALPESQIKVGDSISVVPGMEMKDFHSNALDRTFATIFFSPGIAGSQGINPHQNAAAPQKAVDDPFAAAIAAEQQGGGGRQIEPTQGSGGSMGAIVPFKEISVEKADGENGYTVEEIFARAEDLDGKTVRIKAQVVKFNANIMGKNWLHLQDGSGDPMANTHDLVVTTTEEVAGPDVLTIEGKLTADKDFGAGYKYVVIIEDGVIIK